jgi:hypothetical protein
LPFQFPQLRRAYLTRFAHSAAGADIDAENAFFGNVIQRCGCQECGVHDQLVPADATAPTLVAFGFPIQFSNSRKGVAPRSRGTLVPESCKRSALEVAFCPTTFDFMASVSVWASTMTGTAVA